MLFSRWFFIVFLYKQHVTEHVAIINKKYMQFNIWFWFINKKIRGGRRSIATDILFL